MYFIITKKSEKLKLFHEIVGTDRLPVWPDRVEDQYKPGLVYEVDMFALSYETVKKIVRWLRKCDEQKLCKLPKNVTDEELMSFQWTLSPDDGILEAEKIETAQ